MKRLRGLQILEEPRSGGGEVQRGDHVISIPEPF